MKYNTQNELLVGLQQERLNKVSHIRDADADISAGPSAAERLSRARIAIVLFVAAVFLSVAVTSVQAADLQAQPTSSFGNGAGGVHLVQ